MGWNPFKKVKNALGDWSPFTNRGLDKQFGAIKDFGGPALSIFGAATGNPWISSAGNLVSGYQSARAGQQQSEQDWKRDYQAQKEFAQHGVRWRAADARAAGLSPLAALGGQFQSFTNTVGGSEYGPSIGELGTQFGQDISRAVMAKATERERAAAANAAAAFNAGELRGQQLRNEGLSLENELAKQRLLRLKSTPPPMPEVNQSEPVGTVHMQPSTPIVGSVGNAAKQPGRITDYQELITESGKVIRVPSVDAKTAMEDNLFLEVPWSVRNQMVPELKRLNRYYWNNVRKLIARGERWGAGYQQSRPYAGRRGN